MTIRPPPRFRWSVWLTGATVFTWSYGLAMAAVPLGPPADAPQGLLLLLSGVAAGMVGGYGALLIHDWRKSR